MHRSIAALLAAPSRDNAPPADHARSLRRNFGIGERDAMSAAGTNAPADAERQTAVGISRPGDGTVIFFSCPARYLYLCANTNSYANHDHNKIKYTA